MKRAPSLGDRSRPATRLLKVALVPAPSEKPATVFPASVVTVPVSTLIARMRQPVAQSDT